MDLALNNLQKLICYKPNQPTHQIFDEYLLITLLFHIQLSCDFSDKPTISTYHLPYPLDIDRSPICGRPSAPRVIPHLFATLFELLVTDFFSNRNKNFRFIRCSMFIVRSSVLIAKRPKKEEGK